MRASANDEKVSKRFLFQKEFEEVLIGEGGQEMVVEEQRTPWMGDQKEACTLPRLSVCSHVVLITLVRMSLRFRVPCWGSPMRAETTLALFSAVFSVLPKILTHNKCVFNR